MKRVGRTKTQWGCERGSRAQGRTSTVPCPDQRGGNTRSLEIGLSGLRVWGNLRTEEEPLDLLLGSRKALVIFKRVV